MDLLTNYFLIFLGFIITLAAQLYISYSYKKYKNIKNENNLTGFEIARKILDSNNLKDVHIVEINGELNDHYDPSRKVVRLSNDVFNGTSIAASAVAAHECGHAIQDKDNYIYMKIRSKLVPAVNFSSKLGYFVIFIGILFSLLDLVMFGIILLLVILLFQLVTLPVEFDASRRALIQLNKLNLLKKEETKNSKSMLQAAALTYVASLVTTILEILRLFLIATYNKE